jgi:hypothetical protein
MLRDNIQQSSIPMKQDINGILLFLDSSRSKYLSTTREIFSFSINHQSLNVPIWLMATGRTRTISTGYKIPRNGTITSISVQTSSIVTNGTFQILKNQNSTPITSAQLLGVQSISIDNLDVNLDKDDWLQCKFAPSVGSVDYPIVNLEVAWRE